jgi:hypothetical protein
MNGPVIKVLVFFLLLTQANEVMSQFVIDEEPNRLYYNRTARVKYWRDMKDMRDILHVDKYLMGKNRISGNLSFNTGRVLTDDGRTLHSEIRSALGFFTKIRFFEEFSFNSIFYLNFNPRANARWLADFNYSIGRYNWRSKRINFGYENYVNNRYTDSWKTLADKFLEGYYFLSYNLFSDSLDKRIRIDSTTSLRFTFFTRYSITYRDEREVTRGWMNGGKPVVGAAFRFTIYRGIYIESAVYFYDERNGKKQPWDPDYTYGFGFFDWRAFRISVTYGNWAVNRFPWNKTYYPHYNFWDGNFRVIANWAW